MPEMSFFGVDAVQMRQICLDVGKVGHLQACYCGSQKGQVAKPGTQAESLVIWILLLDLHLIWEKVSHPIAAQEYHFDQLMHLPEKSALNRLAGKPATSTL